MDIIFRSFSFVLTFLVILEKEYLDIIIRRIICHNDQDAFKILFNHYYPKLIQIALTFVPGIIAAEEVVSDVFFKILKNPGTLERMNDFDKYIYVSVKNQSYTYLKKNRHQLLQSQIDLNDDYIINESKNPENSLISDELYDLVSKTINDLPPKRKVVFQLVKEEGKKYREVAEILDISVKTVELQMSLALKQLRKAVKDYLESKDTKVRKLGRFGFFSFLF